MQTSSRSTRRRGGRGARERPRPWPPPGPQPLCLRVDAGRLPASVIDELKHVFGNFPGESEVVLEIHTRTGLRRLRFGGEFRVAGRDAGLRAELRRVLGSAVVPAVPAPA